MILLSSSNMRLSSSSSSSSSFLPTTRSSPAPNFWIASAIGAIFLSPPDLIERWLPMIAPFPTTFNEYQHRRIVNKILNDCWTNDENSNYNEEDMKIKKYGFELEPSDEWIVDNQIQNQNQNQNQNQSQQVIKITKHEDDFDGNHNDNDEMENRYRNQDIIKGTKRDPDATIKSTDSIFLNYFLCLHLLFSLPSSLNEEEQDGNDDDIFANDTDNTMPSMMMKDRKKTTMIMKPSTYGEITPLGARQLFGAMGLYDYNRYRKSQHSDSDADDDDGAHFYDLGSGTGKLVAQAVFELSSPLLGKTTLKKATGIELSPSRHKAAIQSKENTLNTLCNTKELNSFFSSSSSSSGQQQDEYNIYNATATNIINDTNNNKLELIQGDLFDIDLSTATHIYIASLCFPDNLMLKLEERLMTLLTSISKQQQQDCDRDDENDNDNNSEKDDTIIAPATKRRRIKKQKQQQKQQLQCIATLRKFPNDLGGIKPTINYMEMSWTSPLGSAVYLYHVSDRIV